MKNKALKRGVAVLLAALLCLSLFPAALAAGESTLKVSSAEAKAGETVDIVISLENNPGIMSMMLAFEYDAAVLELKEIDFNDAKWTAFAEAYNGDTGNVGHTTAVAAGKEYVPVEVAYQPMEEGGKIVGLNGAILGYKDTVYAEDGDFVTLKFQVAEGAAAGNVDVKVTYDPDNTFNWPGDTEADIVPVDFTVVNGAVTVKDAAAGVKGDINADGVANLADAMLIARSVLSPTHARYKALTPEQAALGDVNNDGVTNLADAMLIARSVLSPTHPRYKPL